MDHHKPLLVDVPGNLCLDNSALMVEAAVKSLGIAFVPEPYARQPLRRETPCGCWSPWSPPIEGLCLYYSSHRQIPATLQAFITALREVG